MENDQNSYDSKQKESRVYRKREHVDVNKIIAWIEAGNKVEAFSLLRKNQCTSPDGCGMIIFQKELCYNHYHMQVKNGRIGRINKKHSGETCVLCKERPATVRDLCARCNTRLANRNRKKDGTLSCNN